MEQGQNSKKLLFRASLIVNYKLQANEEGVKLRNSILKLKSYICQPVFSVCNQSDKPWLFNIEYHMYDDVFLKIYIFTPVSTPHQCFQTTEKLNLRIHNFVT